MLSVQILWYQAKTQSTDYDMLESTYIWFPKLLSYAFTIKVSYSGETTNMLNVIVYLILLPIPAVE